MTASFSWWWGPLWLIATVLVFSVPLLPGLLELRQRRDASPIPIDSDDNGETAYRVKALAERLPSIEGMSDAQPWLLGDRYVVPSQARLEAVRSSRSLKLGSGATAGVLVCDGALELGEGSQVTHLAHAASVVCDGAARLMGRTSADSLVVLSVGAQVFRVAAPCIVTEPLRAAPTDEATHYGPTAMVQVPRRIDGDFDVPAGEVIEDSLVVSGNLRLKAGARIVGHVKAHGWIVLEQGASIVGAAYTQESLYAVADNFIQGPVSAAKSIALGHGSRAGTPLIPCSVSGWDVRLGLAVAVFGSITSVGDCEVVRAT